MRRTRVTESEAGCIFLIVIMLLALYFLPTVLIVALIVVAIKAIVYLVSSNKSDNVIDILQVDEMDGDTFEHYFSTLLKKSGYCQVAVTKASGDYGVDVIAQKDGVKYAFQCKRYNQKVGVSSVQEIFSGKNMYNATKSVVVTNNYFTDNAITLANRLGVELWDRKRLIMLMHQTSKK